MKKLTAMAAVASLALMGSAHAAPIFVDFTDQSLVNADGSTNPIVVALGGGLEMTVTGTPSGVNNSEGGDSACAGAGNFGISDPVFACDTDGLGIGDDEITTDVVENQSVTISFNQAVGLTSAFFLDFFRESNSDLEPEQAEVSINGGPAVNFSAFEVFPQNGGFFIAGLPATNVTSIVFDALPGNDDRGRGDFALAGLRINSNPNIIGEVPVPGAALLFGTALALGAARRKARS
jgi:hypothetical protein